jgi:uncharacterized protein (UPF0332 family)
MAADSKIGWCARKKGGLTLVEPSSNICKGYLLKAEGDLAEMVESRQWEWKISASYHAMYHSLYALLARIGVKCEIHSCTLEFARVFLGEHFTREEIEFLEHSRKAREDLQYYVDRQVMDEFSEKMLYGAPRFHVKCKTAAISLTDAKVNELRKRFTSVLPRQPDINR